MRLTLRTMLAYLDDILDPGDAQDIARRIDESEFATNVVHRTRDTMRRLRLGAPGLYDRGSSVDPNTVAEYLDNTLPPERVPDFEKVCLESDVHLAEAAACHQILTLVLGEPAEVDPASRERMYGLVARRAPAVAPKAALPVPAPSNGHAATAATAAVENRHKPEVPEYLRESAASRGRWALGLAAALLLCGGLAAAAFFFGDRQWLQAWITQADGDGNSTDDASALPGEPDDATDEDSADEESADNTSATAADATDDDSAEGLPERAADEAADGAELAAAGNVVELDLEVPAGAAETDRAVDQAADDDEAPPAPIPADLAAIGGIEEDADDASDDGDAFFPANDTDDMPDDAETGELAAAGNAVENPDAAAEPAVNAESVGRFVSARTVLFRQNAAGGWATVPSLSSLSGGDVLIAPPTFRSTLVLRNGVTVQLLGDSAIELSPSDEDGRLGLRLRQGRAVLMTVGAEPVEMRLTAGDRAGLVTFSDGSSELAVEVRGLLDPGANPTTAAARYAVELFATSGGIQWQDAAGGEALVLDAPSQRRLDLPALPAAAEGEGGADVGNEAPAPTAFPDWIESRPLGQIDQAAAEALVAHLEQPDRSVELGLRELAEHRKREVRALAARSLAAIGQFESLVGLLADAEQRPVWPQQVEALRAAVAAGPETATAVQGAFATVRREDGPALFRMLWGYAAEDLTAGEAARLVEYLEHEDLDFRVLSIWNLHAITGAVSSYRPEYPPARRQQYVLRWQQKLAAGEIVPK